MLPTRLTLGLFTAGLVPLVTEGAYRLVSGDDTFFLPALLGVLAWDVVVALLFAVDVVVTARGLRFRVRREKPARLSVGVPNEVTLLLENLGNFAVRAIVRDHPPAPFRIDRPQLRVRVPAHAWVREAYRLEPSDRGNFSFGDVHARFTGVFGLCQLDRAFFAAEAVQVYPNLLEVRRYEALVRTTLVRTGGYHQRRMPGAGREFSHFRDYTVDDDYRHINWRATARRGKPITAVHESEHSQDIIFALDVGRMMAARVGKLSKLDHAINAVLMLTHVSHRFQDNLGLLVFSHTVHLWLPPAKGRSQHARFLQALYAIKPELCYVNYRQAFEHLIARHPKRALTMVFTDLLDDVVSAEYRDSVRLLKRFHLPLTLAVADVPLQQLAARTPANVDDLYDVQTARDLLHGRAELLRGLERQRVMVVDTVPEQLTIDAVNRYLELKTGVAL